VLSKSFRAVVTATAATGVAITAFGDRYLLVGTVVAMLGIFSIGWPGLLGLPARRSSVVLLLVALAAAVGTQLLTGDLAMVAVVYGLLVVAAFVHELARRDGRPRLVESVAGAVTGMAVIVSGVGWLAIGSGASAIGLLVVGAVTLAVAAVCTSLPLRAPGGPVLTIALASLGGLGVGAVVPAVGMTTGLLVGLAAGLLSAAVHHVLGRFPASGQPMPALAAAVLPVLVCGVPVYVVGRLLLLL